jgi:serine/threonine protein kinase
MGSLPYMAPELLTDSQEVKFGPNIDVWAMGVILFAMVLFIFD